jgi:hypothetical protein
MPEYTLEMYTIYEHPRDYPRSFVVRRSHLEGAAAFVDLLPYALSPHLDGARHVIPEGLVNMGRDVDDDPVIVETWF